MAVQTKTIILVTRVGDLAGGRHPNLFTATMAASRAGGESTPASRSHPPEYQLNGLVLGNDVPAGTRCRLHKINWNVGSRYHQELTKLLEQAQRQGQRNKSPKFCKQ